MSFRGRRTLPESLLREIEARQGGRCAICHGGFRLETHHIIPVSEGGPDTAWNLVLLCPTHHALADLGALPGGLLQSLAAHRGEKPVNEFELLILYSLGWNTVGEVFRSGAVDVQRRATALAGALRRIDTVPARELRTHLIAGRVVSLGHSDRARPKLAKQLRLELKKVDPAGFLARFGVLLALTTEFVGFQFHKAGRFDLAGQWFKRALAELELSGVPPEDRAAAALLIRIHAASSQYLGGDVSGSRQETERLLDETGLGWDSLSGVSDHLVRQLLAESVVQTRIKLAEHLLDETGQHRSAFALTELGAQSKGALELAPPVYRAIHWRASADLWVRRGVPAMAAPLIAAAATLCAEHGFRDQVEKLKALAEGDGELESALEIGLAAGRARGPAALG